MQSPPHVAPTRALDRARARAALLAIPGCDDHRELVRLIRAPRRFFHERFEAHGRVFRSRILQRVVFLIGADANRTLMITRRHQFGFGAGYAQTNVRFIFADSIMLQDGADHRRTRDILGPVVSRLAAREQSEAVATIWRDALDEGARADAVDVYDLSERTTFAAAANVLTGLDLGPETEAMRPWFERIIAGMMVPLPLRIPFGRLDRAMRARETVIEMMRPRIESAREGEPDGLLGQLAQYRDADGTPLPTDDIARHLILLFWAGYDTTASAASWVLHVLARRPDWQTRLREELAAHVGDDVGAVESSKGLVELGHFLKEAERMYPSAIFFPRVALEDIDYGGHTIPTGTPIFYSPYMSHRDPLSFPHPNAFDPDRWNPKADSGREDPAPRTADLVGFGGGPRTCLGKAFALMQLKLMVHALLSRWQIEPEPAGRFTVMALPVHHPVGSRVRLRPL